MNIELTKKSEAASRIHHPYSPSKLQPLEACPKYDSAFTDSEAAQTGTMQHDVADSGEDNSHLQDFKAAAVVECMKFVDEQAKEFGKGCIRLNEEYLPIDDVIIRARVEREAKVGDKVVTEQIWKQFMGTTAGYLDVGLLSEDRKRAKVIDYKFGKVGVESAPNNLQGISYMLGLRKRFPQLEECTVYFLMPHRDEISYHTFTREVFDSLHVRIRAVVGRAVEANKREDDYSLANPTVSACLFCSRIGKCPKVHELALRLGKKYAPLQIPASISTTVFTDPKDVSIGLSFAQVIKTWAEAYRSQVTAKTIDSPTFIPDNYQIVQMQKRSVKKAKALGEFAKTFLPDEMKEKVESLYDIAIGNLEKLISIAAPRGQKERTVEAFGEKALAAGLLELGQPYAFLRQSNKKAEPKESTNNINKEGTK